MLWEDSWLKVQMGFRTSTRHFSWSHGNSSNALAFDNYSSNTTKNGEWIFSLSEGLSSPAAQRFHKWKKSPPFTNDVLEYTNINDCPCALRQLILDTRYQIEDINLLSRVNCRYGITTDEYTEAISNNASYCQISSEEPDLCAYSNNIIWAQEEPDVAVITRCCYKVNDGALISSRSAKTLPLTQWYITTNFTFFELNRTSFDLSYRKMVFGRALESESVAFNDACVATSSCDQYYERRPIPSCETYTPPEQGKS